MVRNLSTSSDHNVASGTSDADPLLPPNSQNVEEASAAVLQPNDVPVNLLSMELDVNYYRPLYLAALKGDWATASKFFERDPNALTAKISVLSMTALHIAVCNGQEEFTEKLVELMPSDALEMHDLGFYTPLHYAGMSGNIRIAKALVRKNPALPQITDIKGYTPLQTAIFVATEHKELVWYLTKVTKDEPPSSPFTGRWAGELICYLTHAGFHDISLHILQSYPNLSTVKDTFGYTLLQVLAMEPSNFPSGSRFSFWERLIYQIVPADTEAPQFSGLPISMQSKTHVARAVLQWLKMWLWKVIDKLDKNILTMAAKLSPNPQLSTVSGAALQMQREMQWFKAVESFMHPAFTELRAEGKTAWHMFQDEHKKLLRDGERWMKDTSNSCMVVSALIATVMFAAAFTVPGGNDNVKGIPIFLQENSFMLYAVSDALALFSSVTSILMFLSILTSRYAEEDFLRALPKRLIIGLASLFIAIAAMMVTFGATLSIVLNDRWRPVSIPIILLASLPVTFFAMLQLPLFIQMVQSTYGRGIFRPKKLW
ncbi:ankyrin repeat-containing protein NPR4-like isoform X3 [Tripterygium wilfordii]|uniref:ankyrin repeat-containing protein NPR4-like isoform X3 n=1 Tax=Tripterygium wilfordii TaxID=458696 RepID=UPI0018F80F11|nr:ankyrin repeat-containing protein NPR4-like isoform X3 [Tripterygium wilfordii]